MAARPPRRRRPPPPPSGAAMLRRRGGGGERSGGDACSTEPSAIGAASASTVTASASRCIAAPISAATAPRHTRRGEQALSSPSRLRPECRAQLAASSRSRRRRCRSSCVGAAVVVRGAEGIQARTAARAHPPPRRVEQRLQVGDLPLAHQPFVSSSSRPTLRHREPTPRRPRRRRRPPPPPPPPLPRRRRRPRASPTIFRGPAVVTA